MKTTTYKWWILGIGLVVVLALLGLGYWGLRGTGTTPGGGQEQALEQTPITGGEEVGPEQVMTAPEISPGPEEAVEIGLQPEAAIIIPAYTFDMAQLAAETRVLPVEVTVADVATIVSLLPPAVLLTPEEAALTFPGEEILGVVEEVVTPRFPFEEDFFYLPPVIGATQPEEGMQAPIEIVPAFPGEEGFAPVEGETMAVPEEAVPAEESLLPEEEQQTTDNQY